MTFDPSIASYYVAGRKISDADLKKILLLFLTLLGDELEDLAAKMVSGEVSLSEWEVQSLELIKSGYIASGILGRGGSTLFDRDAQNLVSADLRFVFGRLDR